ncbi:MAG: hypothetical protein C0404_09415 [Verrucomicrobia bacterium]|nr:hypothetical protein [Verrucomicrobiota bacterium]
MDGKPKNQECLSRETRALVTEARAMIMWGSKPSEVREFLLTNGMDENQAGVVIGTCLSERHNDIRQLGIRNVTIGSIVLPVSVIGMFVVWRTRVFDDIFSILFLAAAYAVWQLARGISRLIDTKKEPGSISDMDP